MLYKTSIRNLLSHKTTSAIQIAGLMVGFAAFILIFLVIRYEESFDMFHPNKDRIYRTVRIGRNALPGELRTGVPVPVTAGLRADFPQLAKVAAIFPDWNVQVIIPSPGKADAKKFKQVSGVFYAEPEFFQMFDFSLAMGDIKSALNDPNTVLLTKELASNYFGHWKTAMGKTFKMDGIPVKVTGILNDIPPNTDFPIKAVLSYSSLKPFMDFNNWGSISDGNYCFVQLADGQDTARLMPQLNAFVDKYIKPVNPNYTLNLQPLSEIHYDSRFQNFNNRTFSKDLIFALRLIGIFLLFMACINFINLTTAQAVNRAREVGVRKVLGSSRSQLVMQFLGETGITTLLALTGAIMIVCICIPPMNSLLDIHLSASALYSYRVLGYMFGTVVLVTFLSGFYPALVLSGFQPSIVLKGAAGADRQRGLFFRRGLVVFQFMIAQALVIATLVVAAQMDYFRNADLGFRKDAVINAEFVNDSLGYTKMDALKADLLKISGVEKVSYSSGAPVGGGNYSDLFSSDNHTHQGNMIVNIMPVDPEYFNLYELPLVAGRVFFPSDTIREYVVNQTVVRRLGIQKDEAALGKMIRINGRSCPIVGVVKDFHVNSLRDPIGPVAMTTAKRWYSIVNVKIDLRQTKSITAKMNALWNNYFPDFTFEYSFLDHTIADFYRQENQLSTLYMIFSAIAIFISCLGLYGLVSFMAVQRRKEIGIRKVLGASVRSIVVIMSGEFTMLVGIAFLIAAPIAWYFMHQWLQQYTYRINLGAEFFIVTILASAAIAWLTVSYTAVRAALANPVNSLRRE
jgi:ABC-type antimicrobial peptide transport system permease subunit